MVKCERGPVGDSWSNGQHQLLLRRVLQHFVHHLWPRTNHAHVAKEYVYQLGEFVELVLPQESAGPGDTTVIAGSLGSPKFLRILDHGSEFKNAERFALDAGPHAAVEHWPIGI